jgi:hypothetical protein
MTAVGRNMPPYIAATIVLLAGVAVLAGVAGMDAYDHGASFEAYFFALILVSALVAIVGTWRRSELGRTVTVIVAVLTGVSNFQVTTAPQVAVHLVDRSGASASPLFLGAFLLVSLLIPRESREWFR